MPTVKNNPLYLSGIQYNSRYTTQAQLALSEKAANLNSGGLSGSFSQLSSPKQFIDLQNLLDRHKNYLEEGKYNSQKLRTMTEKLQTIRSMASQTQTLLSQVRSSPFGSQQEFDQHITDSLNQLEKLLNSSYNGSYLFSGSLNGAAVKDLTLLPDLLPNAAADISYYTGNFETTSFQADESLTITIDSDASKACVEEYIRALRIAKRALLQSGQPIDEQRLAAANDLCASSIQNLIEEEGLLNFKQNSVYQSIEKMQENIPVLSEQIARVGCPTLPELMRDYYEEKSSLTVSFEITLQMIQQLNNMVDRLPHR